MRFVTPVGLFARGIFAAAINLSVLAASVAFAVGWTALVLLNVPSNPEQPRTWAIALSLGAVVVLPVFAWLVEKAIRVERQQLLEGAVCVSDVTLEGATSIESTVRRLATQFDVPEPELRIRSSSTPLACVTDRPEDPILRRRSATTPVLVISEGLVASLPRDELEAVLAHELAHLVNDDLRLLSWLLVPLVAAEKLRQDSGNPAGMIDLVGHVLAALALVGVGVFSRGRELAADRGAATVTGKPDPLASALERLDESTSVAPSTDLRKHSLSTNAVNVLPTLGPERSGLALRSTHPPIDVRIEQLRSLARTQ